MAFMFLLGGVRLASVDGHFSADMIFMSFDNNNYFFDRFAYEAMWQAQTVFSYENEEHIRNMETDEWAIYDRLHEFNRAVNWLNTTGGLYYFVSDGERTLTNCAPMRNEEFFRAHPVYIIDSGTGRERSRTGNDRGFWFDDGMTASIAFTQEAVDYHNAVWRITQREVATSFALMGGAVLAALAALIILMRGAGRCAASVNSNDSDAVIFTVLDKHWLDVSSAALAGYLFVLCAVFIHFTDTAWRFGNIRWIFVLCALLAIKFTLPVIWWLVSFTKRCKAGEWWKYTLIYNLIWGTCGKLRRFALSLWAGLRLTSKVVLLGAAMLAFNFILIVTTVSEPFLALLLSFVIVALAVFVMQRYARKLYLVEQGAKAASNGDYRLPIVVAGGELGSIADSINSISDGINAAVLERMKSERMKTELITNVSHDIRTPLTSLITYTDLLKNEGLDSQKAPEYLDILIQKAARLKALTDDLFEASKAASGNIEVNIEELDLADFVRQVLGELDERVKASGLDFRLNLPEHASVRADGKLLWRVMENLLSNVFKYSLTGSRVYVDIVPDEQWYRLDIKNISEHELNVEPGELTERFKRGDSARAGEGSGLGLSIAQSLVQAQGGRFTLAIDGDLFKAAVYLPK